MKKLIFLASLCIIFAMQSCSSDEEPKLPEVEQAEKVITHMMIKFEGRTYETDAMEVGDSVVYLNKEYDEIYRTKIATNPDIAAIYNSNDPETTYVEYFPSEKALRENCELIELGENQEYGTTENQTRSGIIDLTLGGWGSLLAHAELFDDRNFKDTELIIATKEGGPGSVARLKDYGFNDKASSIKVYNDMLPSRRYKLNVEVNTPTNSNQPPSTTWKYFLGSQMRPILVCYHNSNFSGTVIYCVAPPSGSSDVHADSNLKSIGWNDRISSLSWIICTDMSLIYGNEPVLPPHKEC